MTKKQRAVFLGGDPRTFRPDPDEASDEERAAWARDCLAWERGERVYSVPVGWDVVGIEGGTVRVAHPAYGLGYFVKEEK